ncbi:MAG: tetratricopeptide repeat protein [Deltaproteobacteria bacterium]
MKLFRAWPLLLFLLASACASTNLAPHTGTTLHLEDDEKRIWKQADQGETWINRSRMVLDSPELEAYLEEITRKLFPDLPFSCRVRVVKDSSMNAFALPNGAIYIHMGLLARMENEAQLAALLGHETTHAANRHALKKRRELKNVSALCSAVTLGGYGGWLGWLFTMASITGYDRDLEREADVEGYRRMVAAGYEPSEAPKLFQILDKWLAETGVEDPYFFSSHPKLQERIENFKALAAADPRKGTGADNREIFLSKTNWIVFENTELDLKAGRFESALKGSEKYLATAPGDARGNYLRGEIFRQRNSGNDIDLAVECYLKAISLNASHPESHRALGLIYLKKGQRTEALKYLERYLALNPEGPDRAYIESYIRSLQ